MNISIISSPSIFQDWLDEGGLNLSAASLADPDWGVLPQ